MRLGGRVVGKEGIPRKRSQEPWKTMDCRAKGDAGLCPKQEPFLISRAEVQENIYPAGFGNYYCRSLILSLSKW